jgi:Small acid-soluble spore protein H family.
MVGVIKMDVNRARQIIKSTESVEVLHEGTPVWLERVLENNTADITKNNRKENVPIYMLVEK